MQWKEAKVRTLPKVLKHRSNTLTISSNLYHTTVETDGAKLGSHIPLSNVSRPAVHSGILGSIYFPPHWLHISCHYLPTSHRYQPAAIQSFCRRHLTGLFQGVRYRPTITPRCSPSWLNSNCRRLSTTGWCTFSAATRTKPCSVETSRAREASRPASYRARALDQSPTLSHCLPQQLISDRSTATTYSSSSLMTLTSSYLPPISAQGPLRSITLQLGRRIITLN